MPVHPTRAARAGLLVISTVLAGFVAAHGHQGVPAAFPASPEGLKSICPSARLKAMTMT
jgi:hypothetical protein